LLRARELVEEQSGSGAARALSEVRSRRSRWSEAWIDAGRGSWDTDVDQQDGPALAGIGPAFSGSLFFEKILVAKFFDFGGN
jgi:hypothetical protein